MSNLTLHSLIADWAIERALDIIIIGPDNISPDIYYLEIPAAKLHWSADIDNGGCFVILRIGFQPIITIHAADPDFFTKLETHIYDRMRAS